MSHVTSYKLAGVVLRRRYLPSIATAIEPDGTLDEAVFAPHGFWLTLARDMITRSYDLISIVNDFFANRSPKLGFATILIFGLYVAGNVCLYLVRWPSLCIAEAAQAVFYLQQSLDILAQLGEVWPMANAWHDALRTSTTSATLSPGGLTGAPGQLKATATAERSADETVGIYRHTNSRRSRAGAHPSPASSSGTIQSASPPFAVGAAAALTSPNSVQPLIEQPAARLVPPASALHFGAAAELTAAEPAQSLFPLTSSGLPYDALEDDLLAFFRGEVPSFADPFADSTLL